MNEYILEAQDLHFNYPDGTKALKGVSLGITKGQTVALLGGNGTGKSTLLLSFNGILRPSAGRVLFRGSAVDYSHQGLNELRKSVGIVFQDPDSQLFSASVFQDVSFGVVNMKLPEAEARRRVQAALERTGIAHLRDKPTHCLSYGQKKRAAIAGILAMEPEVLILDEPTAGLDPQGVSEILKLLKRAQHELGMSVVIATHDIDIVPLYCDAAYVLHEGRVVLAGTPQEIFAQKETLRRVNLRLPRIGHLMEILQEEDDFEFTETAVTISAARKVLNDWKKGLS